MLSLMNYPVAENVERNETVEDWRLYSYDSVWNPSQSYGASPVIWDRTTTRHRWKRPALTPARQTDSRFTYVEERKLQSWFWCCGYMP